MNALLMTAVILTNTLRFELAITPAEKERGMMYRKTWGRIDGMIFVNREPQRASFWMKNTPLPLVLYFLDDDLRILEKHEGVPWSEAVISSSNNGVRYVLETRHALTNFFESRPAILRPLKPRLEKILLQRADR